jgi:hypothetical protein
MRGVRPIPCDSGGPLRRTCEGGENVTFSVKGVSGLSPWHMMAKNVSHAGQPRRAPFSCDAGTRGTRLPVCRVPLGALLPHVEKDEDVVGTYPKHDEQG